MNKTDITHGLLSWKLLIMKFVIIFLLLSVCNAFAASYGQNEKLPLTFTML